ncbi:carbohydrate ABC transporter permease [Streptomyces thermocarboxydus]
MAVITWKYLGFAVILMLAGLQSIPDEIFEAAQIDGASYWQIQRRITLPLLGPTIRIWAFLSIIGSLQLFDLVYIIWGQYVSGTAGTSTMAIYMLAQGRNAGNYGYGSAVAVVMFVISLVVALIYQRFVLRRDLRGAVTEGPCDERDDHPHPEAFEARRRPRHLLRGAAVRRRVRRAGALHRARGFRTNAHITTDPAALPDPGSPSTTSASSSPRCSGASSPTH